ncbi:MAG: hypothetical protein IJV96_00215 [Clostridia bacterium]|nr:hypothetical protein [Clostridia bacterium]
MYLSIDFQEEYKRLDHLCKDCLRSGEGVSEYIRQMEATAYSGRRFVRTWEDDYQQLKHVRWVRNQLAHEVGTLESDICTEEDLAWVESFYERIINGTDPFTLLRKAKEEEARRAAQRARAEKQEIKSLPQQQTPPVESRSIWDKLVSRIKRFFS